MNKDMKRKKQQAQSQKQSKIRSIMSNVVGAGAAVAVAVVALSSSVDAYFRELFVFEDTIFYTVEVIETYDEENGDPENLPIRLVIEDQFDTVYYDLSYGETSGEINNLTVNNIYKFKIQIQKDIGWITLESTQVSTYEKLDGAVYDLTMDENYKSSTSDLTFGVFVQEGIEVLSDLYLEIVYEGQLQTFPLTYGNQTVIVPDFSYTSLMLETSIYAQVEDGELLELHNKTFELRPYFEASVGFDYIDTTTMNVTMVFDESSINSTYVLLVYKNDRIIDTVILEESLTSISVEPYQSYTFEIYGRYNKERYLLVQYEMQTDTPPFSIIQVLQGVGQNRLTVNVFEYDSSIYGRVYVIIEGETYYLDDIAAQDNMFVAQGWIPLYEGNLNIYLEIIGQPDVEYILETIGA